MTACPFAVCLHYLLSPLLTPQHLSSGLFAILSGLLSYDISSPNFISVVLYYFEALMGILCQSLSPPFYIHRAPLCLLSSLQKRLLGRCSTLGSFFKFCLKMQVDECSACMSMHHMGAWCPQKSEEDIRAPGTRLTSPWNQTYELYRPPCGIKPRSSGKSKCS